MARQKLSLNFGGGLDRKTGVGAVDPDAFIDLRNVCLYKGRMMRRRGNARVLDIGWGTDIVGIFSVRAQGLAAVIVYDNVSRDVRMYLVDGELEVASLVGTVWSALSPVGTLPPQVSAADFFDQLVIAHAEPVFSQRQATRVYTVSTSALADLTSDLDRSGVAETVKFFAVKRHHNIIVGVGYGTGADEDSPDTARLSNPGALVFVPESYFNVGVEDDPIIDMVKSGDSLEFLKARESYFLTGNGPKTYDVVPGDENYGIAAFGLAVCVGDNTAYRWSLDGPRVSRGGPSEDLEMPLNLGGPLPDADAGGLTGFAYFDATEGEVVFVFTTWGYVLHLKDGRRRWSYREFAVPLVSAGRIYEGGSATLDLAEPMVASVTEEVPTFVGADVEPKATVTWTMDGTLVGGEQVEVWRHSVYDGWALMDTVDATDLMATITLRRWLTTQTIALRTKLGGSFGVGYTSGPDAWPATAKDTVIASGDIVAFTIGDWNRLSGTRPARLLEIVGTAGPTGTPQGQCTFKVEASTDGGSGWAEVVGSPFAWGDPMLDERLNADVNATTVRYRVTVIGADASIGPETNGELDTLFEPKSPYDMTVGPDLGGGAGHLHHIDGSDDEPGAVIACSARHLAAGSPTFELDITPGVGVDFDVPTDDVGTTEITYRTKLVGAFATDYSTAIVEDSGVA